MSKELKRAITAAKRRLRGWSAYVLNEVKIPASDLDLIVAAAAAAPALVEALEEMVEAYWGLDDDKNGDGISPPPKCIIKARAALSIAKGETP